MIRIDEDMPSESVIVNEIQCIVEKGMDVHVPFLTYLKNMYKQVGIKVLFCDGLEILFMIGLVGLSLYMSLINVNIYNVESGKALYPYIFTVSPVLFLIMGISSFVRAKESSTIALEMTSKYNMYEIAALRMLIFSVVCIICNSVFVYSLICKYKHVNFMQAYMISIASLFIFSTIFLAGITKIKIKWIRYVIIGGWIVMNFIMSVVFNRRYANALDSISVYIWCGVVIVFLATYMKNLKKLIYLKNIERVV